MERVFIDWRSPSFLESAADLLLERFIHGRDLDMRHLLLVLPNGRARRRLEQILVQKAEDMIRTQRIEHDWYPPVLITLELFPELLYQLKLPAAKNWTQYFAWCKVLRRMAKEKPDQLACLLPAGLPDDDMALVALAKMFASLHRELAADRYRFDQITERINIPKEKKRWEVLCELQKEYHNLLDQLGQWDIQTARIYALDHHDCQTDQDIYVIGAVDLNKVQKKMLLEVGEKVHLIVCAPESEADGFDEFGSLIPDFWVNKMILIPDEQIVQVEKPSDQADQIMNYLAEYLPSIKGKVADSISIGVPDHEVIPSLIQKMERNGIPYHISAGTSMIRNRVYSLISLLARYHKNARYSDLAELIRHPDLERYLIRRINETESGDPIEAANWISDFDRLQNDLILERISFELIESFTSKSIDMSKMKTVITLIDDLLIPFRMENGKGPHREMTKGSDLPDPVDADEMEMIDSVLQKIPQIKWICNEKRKPLGEWCVDLSQLICKIYPDSDDRGGTVNDQIDEGIKRINKCLSQFSEIPGDLQDSVSASFVFDLLIKNVGSLSITFRNPENAVPLVGWLELLLDDRPYLIISGMNEGIVPTAISDDPFLPNTLRNDLDLPDNRHRYARDVWALSVLHASHPHLKIVFGRYSQEGDPLEPGRLLFMTDTQTIVQRVCQFFGKQEKKSEGSNSDLVSDNPSGFVPPVLHPKGDPPTEISVTAFKDFLFSPYTFFLKHCFKLENRSDTLFELDSLSFGKIVHGVLSSFANRSEMKEETDPDRLGAMLSALLDSGLKKRFSEYTSPVVPIQIELIRRRLTAFARWQTQWRSEGNCIKYSEVCSDDPVLLNIPNEDPIILCGRIDRIDYNEKTGDWYIFDYKTFETVTTTVSKNKTDHSVGDRSKLLLNFINNEVDQKHRKKIGNRRSPIQVLCEKYFSNVSFVGNSRSVYEWTDLQLPLYRHIFRKILEQEKIPYPDETKIHLGYIVLPKSKETVAYEGPWTTEDLQEADEMAFYVVRMIRKLWSQEGGIPFDLNAHTQLPPNFTNDFASITMEKRLR